MVACNEHSVHVSHLMADPGLSHGRNIPISGIWGTINIFHYQQLSTNMESTTNQWTSLSEALLEVSMNKIAL